MDEAWELPVIQVMNDLAYLKAKGAYERQQLKQWRNK